MDFGKYRVRSAFVAILIECGTESGRIRRGSGATVSSERFPLGAIIGPARSGTTWAGALVNSSPEVIYRFEPFHRLAKSNVEVRDWFQKLKEQAVNESDLPAIYSVLLPAHPLTDKAPFFEEKAYPVRTLGRRQVWPLARLFGPLRTLYRVAYSPEPGAKLVFKEVTFVRPLKNLLERTSMPVVYLVRHPCATVLSSMHAPHGSSIASTHLRLARTLRKDAPEFAERFGEIIDGADLVRQHALMWLYEVESCVAAVRASGNGMVMTYEELADDAYTAGAKLFRHLRISFEDPSRRFIDGLYGLDTEKKGTPRRTGWGSAYYSVYRNPRELKDSWKNKLANSDRKKVESIVQGMPEIEYCASLGAWW